MQERWYQTETAEALMDFVECEDGHPVAVLPTGAGKTHTMCLFVNAYMTEHPEDEIVVLSHVAEILEQDYAALTRFFGEAFVGLWSASLKTKEKKKITVAGIQSVWREPERFAKASIIIIDECHLVNPKESGMYRSFLSQIEAIYVGLTATHFRLGHGYIHEGESALFTDIAYDLSSFENFNRLVDECYLSKLITAPTKMKMDVDGVRVRGGDFKQDDLSDKFDKEEITNAAIDEIIKYGKKYKKWMVFAIDIAHAEHITHRFWDIGIPACVVHSKMKGDRKQIIQEYKGGKYRVIVNVDVLTTGFDVPDIDLIAMLRPTQSPVIHVQTIGRGLRVVYAGGYDLNTIDGRRDAIEAGPKQHCLILDFAGNTRRLGPINDVIVKSKHDKKEGNGAPITKECPECGCICHPSVKICDGCGWEFKFKHKLQANASNEDVMKRDKEDGPSIEDWFDVHDIRYSIHEKKGKPSSLRVQYKIGMSTISEWICYDHKGYPKHRADNWVKFRIPSGEPMPQNVADLFRIARSGGLYAPKKIFVNIDDKFPTIKDSQF